MSIHAAQKLVEEGSYVKAAEIINSLKGLSTIEKTERDIVLARLKMDNGLFTQAEEIIKKILRRKTLTPYHRYYSSILHCESISTRIEVDTVIIELVTILREIRTLNIPEKDFLVFHTLSLLVFNLCDKGNFEDVDEYLNEMDIIATKLDSPLIKIISWHQRARMLDYKGNLLECEKYYTKVVNYKPGKKYSFQYSKSLHNLANLYYYKGDYQKAIEAFDKENELHVATGNEYNRIITTTDKAWCYFAMGEVVKSVSIYASAYNFIKDKEDLDYKFRTEVLSRLIMILCQSGRVQEAKNLLADLEDLVDLNLADKIKKYYSISYATILKTSKQSRNRAKAMELFETIATEQLFDIEFTLYSYFSLAELLIYDYLISQEEELIDEIDEILKKLYQIGESQNSLSVRSQTDWLGAKIALLKNDLESAKKLLVNAMLGAEQLGYLNLAHRISNELDEIGYSLEVDQDLIERSMLEGNLAETILYNQKTHGSDESIMFFIMADSGLPLYSRVFSDDIELDENLISSFIHAINMFGSEALQTGDSIKRIQYQDFIILIEIINDIHFVYVLRGKSYPGVQKLNNFINKFQEDETFWKIRPDFIFLEEEDRTKINQIVEELFL